LLPNLEADIRSLVDPESQADPKFQSTFLYARITAIAVRAALVSQKNYDSEQLPLSIDTKAKVKIGNLSRGGKARTIEPKSAYLIRFLVINPTPDRDRPSVKTA